MQVDFANIRHRPERMSVFIATLAWESGPTWSLPTTSGSRPCWLPRAAFYGCGGVPREVLCDNMRTVLTPRNAFILRYRVPLRVRSDLLDEEPCKENSPPHRSPQSATPFQSFLRNCE
jgi:transposase